MLRLATRAFQKKSNPETVFGPNQPTCDDQMINVAKLSDLRSRADEFSGLPRNAAPMYCLPSRRSGNISIPCSALCLRELSNIMFTDSECWLAI